MQAPHFSSSFFLLSFPSFMQCCCQGLKTQGQGLDVQGRGQGQGVKLQGQGQGRGLELQGQGQGLGPALIHTFLVGTEHEVMSLVVYCRCHVTDKQRSALDSEILPLLFSHAGYVHACPNLSTRKSWLRH